MNADFGSMWNEVIIAFLLNLSHYLAVGTEKNEENLSGYLVTSPSFEPETSKYETELLQILVWNLII